MCSRTLGVGSRYSGLGVGFLYARVGGSQTLLVEQLGRHRSAVDWQAEVMTDAAQLGDLLRCAFHLQQREQLSVAVLLDDIDAAAAIDEVEHLWRERVGAQPQIRRAESRFLGQLVT